VTLLRLTLKSIADKKVRFAMTTLSVVLGVAFVVGTFIVTDSLRSTFGDLSQDIAGQVDLYIRSDLEFGERFDAAPVDPALLGPILAVEGVETADGGFIQPNVVIQNADGETLETQGPQFGINWSVDSRLSQVWPATEDSRRPENSGEFAVDVKTGQDEDLVLGDTYTIQLPTGRGDFTLVGYMNFGDPDENKSIAQAQLTAFDTDTAVEILRGGDGYDDLRVIIEPGADIEAVQAGVAALLPDNLEVVQNDLVAEERADEFNEFIDIFQYILLAFAVVTLVVSAFIIYNTFTIVLGQRIHELGLLRAVGASGSQISASVLGESVVVGIVATLLGLVAGMGIAVVLDAIFSITGFELPVDPTELRLRTVFVAIVVGVGITVASALPPAMKARRVSPMAALRDDVRLSSVEVARRPMLGGALTLLGLAAIIFGLTGSWQRLLVMTVVSVILFYVGGTRLNPIFGRLLVIALGAALLVVAAVADFGTVKLLVALGGGALVIFLGINLISPLFARPVARGIGWPLPKIYGVTGRLSRENAARAPRRTASTAAALMIGLALVGTVSVLGSSLKATFDSVLDRSVTADWFMCVGDCNNPFDGFGQDFAIRLAELPELESVNHYRARQEAARTPDGELKDVLSAEMDLLDDHLDADVIAGDLADVGIDGLAIFTDVATDYDLDIDDTIDLEFAAGDMATFRIGAIYEDARILGNWVISNDAWDLYLVSETDQFMSAVTAPGVSEGEARTAIQEIADDYPQVTVQTKDEFRDARAAQVDQGLQVINVFLGLALIIALMGIANTLALSVFERTRELGLLRAVGMKRRQMRRMVRWEGAIVAVFGGMLGVVLGIVFGVVAVIVIPDSIIDRVDVPVKQLLIYLVIAGLAGLLSAYFPARRAAKLNVLDAISHD
jgi:putative ABC transport system permease protein